MSLLHSLASRERIFAPPLADPEQPIGPSSWRLICWSNRNESRTQDGVFHTPYKLLR
jgi:hypothetical protein